MVLKFGRIADEIDDCLLRLVASLGVATSAEETCGDAGASLCDDMSEPCGSTGRSSPSRQTIRSWKVTRCTQPLSGLFATGYHCDGDDDDDDDDDPSLRRTRSISISIVVPCCS